MIDNNKMLELEKNMETLDKLNGDEVINVFLKLTASINELIIVIKKLEVFRNKCIQLVDIDQECLDIKSIQTETEINDAKKVIENLQENKASSVVKKPRGKKPKVEQKKDEDSIEINELNDNNEKVEQPEKKPRAKRAKKEDNTNNNENNENNDENKNENSVTIEKKPRAKRTKKETTE